MTDCLMHDEPSECVGGRNKPWLLMNGTELIPASMLMLRLIAVGYFLPVTTVKGTVRCLDKSVIESVLKCFGFGVFESIVRIKQVLALG